MIEEIETTENTDNQEVNWLDMSDEEFSKQSFPEALPAESVTETSEDTSADTEGQTDAVEEVSDEAAPVAGDKPAQGDAEEEAVEDNEDKEPVGSETGSEAIDYEAEYKRLIAPFKANGREVQVKSVDDAVTLMQMGANYNKKMAALKPNLKLLKMLENNGLLSEEKLSYLIDLDKKNPGAINKLVKESGLDPLDLDTEKADAYRPQVHAVDDREIVLDTVLDEIQDTPTYTRTLGIVSNEWDGPSKRVIADNPQLLKVINDHVARGIYDQIVAEVERERMFGRLNGLSDIEAYRTVGDAIQARNGFNSVMGNPEQAHNTTPANVASKAKADEESRAAKRRAASASRPVAPKTVSQDFNPLAMSDEEFLKLVSNKFR